MKKEKKTCGAKTRTGGRCQKPPMENGRCRLHGGATRNGGARKGNKNAAKPGSPYSKFLTPEEENLFNHLSIDVVDEELRLAKIRLTRLLNAERATLSQDGLKQLETVSAVKRATEGGEGRNNGVSEVALRRRDYEGQRDRALGRIESLTKTRAELLRTAPNNEDDTPQPVRVVINVVDASKPKQHAESES